MKYIVDSDLIIDQMNAAPPTVLLFDKLSVDGMALSIVSYMEVLEGLLRQLSPEDAVRQFESEMSPMLVLEFSPAVALRTAIVRAGLRRAGRRVSQRSLDLIIAATAIEHDLTLVTRNVADYRDIDGLSLREA